MALNGIKFEIAPYVNTFCLVYLNTVYNIISFGGLKYITTVHVKDDVLNNH